MPLRDQIRFILHDVQANSRGAFTLENPTPIDPRIEAVRSQTSSGRVSPAPSKGTYSKSRKRTIIEVTDDSDEPSPSSAKKLDIRIALTALTREIERNKKAKEETNQQKAVRLLEKIYTKRLELKDFLKAISLFKDNTNTVTFLTLNDSEIRDI